MPSILVVDDERDIRESLRGVLEDEGYKVLLAESGEACLEQLKKRVVRSSSAGYLAAGHGWPGDAGKNQATGRPA